MLPSSGTTKTLQDKGLQAESDADIEFAQDEDDARRKAFCGGRR